MSVTTGQKIRHVRQKKGWTQWQLSQAVGITPARLFLIERGDKDCSGTLIVAIADVLGVKSSDLVGK